MSRLFKYGYTAFVYLYYAAIKLVSWFFPKAHLWLKGREDVWARIGNIDLKNCIWFHASSLGEFEQISFLIKRIREELPNQKILVSFFSPSGYEHRKDFQYADAVCYLPWDFEADVERFLDIVSPKIVFWVRYDFWECMLTKLKTKSVPVILLNGVFRSNYSSLYQFQLKRILPLFSQLYVINSNSQLILNEFGFNAEIMADTRFDRMDEIRNQEWSENVIEQFIGTNPVYMFGSAWSSDIEFISKLKQGNEQWIIVPHEVDEKNISDIQAKFEGSRLFTDKLQDIKDSHILILNKIGLLSKLYRYASVVYVGGGFNKVVHSLVEPLAYACPIVIGTNISKSEEAIDLLNEGLVYQTNGDDLSQK
ncbi:MAG: 3-deoxy-D-manno-octulosonic acid transferase, partial [Chitinophagales bacterium]